jgi:hypothetical protein
VSSSLPHFMLHRNIGDGARQSRSIESPALFDPADAPSLC